MAEETQKPTDQVVPTTTTTTTAPETITENPPPAEPVIATSSDNATPPPPPPAEEINPVATEEVVAEAENSNTAAADNRISESESFKEETNVVGELPDPQKKALDELKQLIQGALNKREFTVVPKAPEEKKEEEGEKKVEKEVTEEKTEEVKECSTSEEPKPEAEVETVVEVVEKIASSAEEDGEITVEAIQESKVSVTVTTEAGAETKPQVEEEAVAADVAQTTPEEVELWGIPLLADERSDAILLKFLRARDFKVKESFTMIKNTVIWRKEFGIDALIEEDLGNDWDKVVFTDGYDKEGHIVCYNVFGEFENKDLYEKTFSDEEKRNKFIRWRIQCLEKSVRKLDFSPTGISRIVEVNDLKNSLGHGKRELTQASNQALQLLHDNYPEFVAKHIFINVPWWYLAYSRMLSAFLTTRNKSKFVFAGSSKSADTLFKYIAPEQVPVQYGGLSREGEQEGVHHC